MQLSIVRSVDATRVVLLAENDDGATESRMERAFLKALKGGKVQASDLLSGVTVWASGLMSLC